jgi:mannitol-1-/sugar-/sorbitol-6-/2-deoxyglucose-6-phosphatase
MQKKLQFRSIMITTLDTVIFDMDGLLIDSEPIWEKAGGELVASYGHTLSRSMYASSTGLRTKEWLQYWFNHFGISSDTIGAAEKQIVDLVIGGIQQHGEPLPGVKYVFEYFQQKGFKIGLATSSPMRLADLVVHTLGIGHYLQAINSAEFLPFGKPHPEVFLQCAQQLQSNPLQCVCFEDSYNGMIAAKAAKMKCVVVPAPAQFASEKWGAADAKVSSLLEVNDEVLIRL